MSYPNREAMFFTREKQDTVRAIRIVNGVFCAREKNDTSNQKRAEVSRQVSRLEKVLAAPSLPSCFAVVQRDNLFFYKKTKERCCGYCTCWFTRDVTPAMLVVKNNSISLLWELNSIFTYILRKKILLY